MKAAILGTGTIAHTHAAALRSSGIDIQAVVNRHLSKAQAFGETWQVPVITQDPSVLLADEIDCVHICTPPTLHAPMIRMLLEKGKALICEKPLTLTTDEARDLVALAESRDSICAVNFNVRYHDACQKAREIVQAPDFGNMLLIHGTYLQEFHALPAPLDWRYQPELAGSMRAVTEIGSHWLDLAQHLSGQRIQAVAAVFGCFRPERQLKEGLMTSPSTTSASEEAPQGLPIPSEETPQIIRVDSEDAACVHLRFENGAIGSMVLSEVSQGRMNHLTMEITGTRRNLWWNSEAPGKLHQAEKGSGIQTEVMAFGGGFTDSFTRLFQEVYADLRARKHTGVSSRSKGHPYPTFREASRIVALSNAIETSASEAGKWVTVHETF
ncbi:Gfo/Idh/MocA family protein [Anoxynatronum buryatiense]|uniref:Predicted dehydrogenase n=1 Tax=Anoxynatronum buryatiense TaxID=489973 RepID=A0AA45WZ14_9CLOT|nr:Gfo/Idh/MocA family oxidoreductase [Anoxynatronum buryatiense]SMP69286.1 Predicted dehydrogenase [Anoxynatronum buryatiense]